MVAVQHHRLACVHVCMREYRQLIRVHMLVSRVPCFHLHVSVEEESEELSYIRDLLVPIFSAVGIPFNRTTFLLLFVVGFSALVGLVIWLTKKAPKVGKGMRGWVQRWQDRDS